MRQHSDYKSNPIEDSYGLSVGRNVHDPGLRKLLSDKNMSEMDRLNAVKQRAEQIENKAKL